VGIAGLGAVAAFFGRHRRPEGRTAAETGRIFTAASPIRVSSGLAPIRAIRLLNIAC
jgi:hypothetical protein